jgi:hypothetical protein
LQDTYRRLRPLNFSKDVLEPIAVHFPAAISVLPVLRVTWSDWGSRQRLLETKQIIDQLAESRMTKPLETFASAARSASEAAASQSYGAHVNVNRDIRP